MGDDLQGNLENYQLQLQQVEAALTVDPDNEDLKKLRDDLQEVTNLTLDLIKNQAAQDTPTEEDHVTAATASSTAAVPVATKHGWKTGDKCIAMWSEDGTEYESTIDEILEDGTCTVTFDGYGNTDVTQVSLLKKVEEGSRKRPADGASTDGPSGSANKLSKKDLIAQQRELKRKKSQKKALRRKELDEERELDKNKWLNFNSKMFTKGSRGCVKKSIFASPEEDGGKVGVGTCGLGGRPMTSYHQNEKWKKGNS